MSTQDPHDAPHFDYSGLCTCGCSLCTSDDDDDQCCICPECDPVKCGLHPNGSR